MKLFSKAVMLGTLSGVPCIAMDRDAPQKLSLEDLKTKDADTLADLRYNLDINWDEVLEGQANKIEGLRIKRKVLQAQRIRTERRGVSLDFVQDAVSKSHKNEQQTREYVGSGLDKSIESEIIIQEIDKRLTSILKDLEKYAKTSISTQEVGKAINKRLNVLKELYRQTREQGSEKKKIIEELESMIFEVIHDTRNEQKNIQEIERLLLLLKGRIPDKPADHISVDHEKGLNWEPWLEQQRQEQQRIIEEMGGDEEEYNVVIPGTLTDREEETDLSYSQENIILSVDELRELGFDISQERLKEPGMAWRCIENVCSWVSSRISSQRVGRTSEEIDQEIEARRVAILGESAKNILSILNERNPHMKKEEILRWLSKMYHNISPYLDMVEDYLKQADERFSKYTEERKLELLGNDVIQNILLQLMSQLKEEDRQRQEEQRRVEASSSSTFSGDSSNEDTMIHSSLDQIGKIPDKEPSSEDSSHIEETISREPEGSNWTQLDEDRFQFGNPFDGGFSGREG